MVLEVVGFKMSEVTVENILKVIRKNCIVKPSGGFEDKDKFEVRTHHKTLLKVILNPILRKFGFQIVSCFDGNTFLKYEIRKFQE